MNYIFSILLFTSSLWAGDPCLPLQCSADEIYFDALSDENYCQVNTRVSCEFSSFGSEFNRLLDYGGNPGQVVTQLSERRSGLVENINLRGLLDRVENSFSASCSNNMDKNQLRNCVTAVQFAEVAYVKARSLFRSLVLPYYSHLETNREVADLYQISEENHVRTDFFKTLKLDLKIEEDLELWKLLQIVKEASRNERARVYICNDSPLKMDYILGQQKLLFQSGVIKKNTELALRALKSIGQIEKVGLIYKKTCNSPQVIEPIQKKIHRELRELATTPFIKSQLDKTCSFPSPEMRTVCNTLKAGE